MNAPTDRSGAATTVPAATTVRAATTATADGIAAVATTVRLRRTRRRPGRRANRPQEAGRLRPESIRSRPSRPLFIGVFVVVTIAVVLPYTPLGSLLGFTPLPLPLLVA